MLKGLKILWDNLSREGKADVITIFIMMPLVALIVGVLRLVGII